jgi:hypothetical protein
MSSEIDIAMRYGLIERERADQLPEEKTPEGLVVRIFDEDEDRQWRMGVLMARAKNKGVTLRIKPDDPEPAIQDETAAQARREGKVPFRIVGPKAAIPGFLKQAGLAEVEFIA